MTSREYLYRSVSQSYTVRRDWLNWLTIATSTWLSQCTQVKSFGSDFGKCSRHSWRSCQIISFSCSWWSCIGSLSIICCRTRRCSRVTLLGSNCISKHISSWVQFNNVSFDTLKVISETSLSKQSIALVGPTHNQTRNKKSQYTKLTLRWTGLSWKVWF